MPVPTIPDAVVSVAASFPGKRFLENLAARHDGSLLVTAVLTKELWYVPAPRPDREVTPQRLHTFDHLITGIAEVEPDVFVLSLCDAYTTHESHLVRVDFNDWVPGTAISPETIYSFSDDRAGSERQLRARPGRAAARRLLRWAHLACRPQTRGA